MVFNGDYSLFNQPKDEKTQPTDLPWLQLNKAIHDCSVIAEATEDEDIKSWVKSLLRDLLATQANAFRAVFSATVRTNEDAEIRSWVIPAAVRTDDQPA